MEAAALSETQVPICQTARPHTPEGRNTRTYVAAPAVQSNIQAIYEEHQSYGLVARDAA